MIIEWLGEDNCNVCSKYCSTTLYDAKTIYGHWATLCEDCFKLCGMRLGTGFGQKYKRNSEGRLIKVEG